MLMSSFSINQPFKRISSGLLQTSGEWTHPNRLIDSHVLIIGLEGKAYLCQDDTPFTVEKGDIVLLSAFHHHFGTKPSTNQVRYYWTHFYTQEKPEEWLSNNISLQQNSKNNDSIVIPLFQKAQNLDRLCILFRQMLHMANKNSYKTRATDYLFTVLMLEIFEQFYAAQTQALEIMDSAKRIAEISEWIRVNIASNDLHVKSISKHFNYNPDYLSRMFKKYTGHSLVQTINATKINMAKTLLLNTNKGIQEIANTVGYTDEKYFMRVFRNIEGITPGQFRNAFYYIHMNVE